MKIKSKNYSNKNYIIFVILFFIIIILSYFNFKNFLCEKSYKFISNQCQDLVIDKKAYLELKLELEKYIEESKKSGDLNDASVYFRDLNRGPVMGINEHSDFSSASLLKLPIIMTIYKMAESRPEILDFNLVNEGENTLTQFFNPDESIKNNVPYSVREVIKYALVYSDNKAISMLNDFIAIEGDYENNLQVVFRELGLILPDDLTDRDISTRSYASLYRLLYNSSYLSPEYSEIILETLSQSNFKIGLKAGVPNEIKVSNKFGERFLDNGERQLHDCGIIYYPNNPYLLCVMTQGDDFDKLTLVIKEISEKFYKEVDSRKL